MILYEGKHLQDTSLFDGENHGENHVKTGEEVPIKTNPVSTLGDIDPSPMFHSPSSGAPVYLKKIQRVDIGSTFWHIGLYIPSGNLTVC